MTIRLRSTASNLAKLHFFVYVEAGVKWVSSRWYPGRRDRGILGLIYHKFMVVLIILYNRLFMVMGFYVIFGNRLRRSQVIIERSGIFSSFLVKFPLYFFYTGVTLKIVTHEAGRMSRGGMFM